MRQAPVGMRTVARWAARAAPAIVALVLAGTAAWAAADSPQIARQELAGTTFLNGCTGEQITITEGALQFLVRTSEDEGGGQHVVIHGSAQGVVATGAVTGSMYRLAGDFWTEENVAGDGSPLEVQMVEMHAAISTGSADNLIVHVVSHLTINPDGAVTASVDSVTTECRG